MKKKPAFISAFSAFVLCFTVSLSFILIDAVRMAGMAELFQQRANLTARNMFANYERELYSHFGLLGMDQEYSRVGEKNGLKNTLQTELAYDKEGIDFLRYQSFEVEGLKYQLLSDGNGAVYRKQVSEYMLSFLPDEVVEEFLTTFRLEDSKEVSDLSKDVLEDAEDALEDVKEEIENGVYEEDSFDRESLEDNEITEYKEKKSHPILSMVLGEENFSENMIKGEFCPSKRKCKQGTLEYAKADTVENLLALNYARMKFLNYTTADPEGDGIQYQLEYLVGGKSCDSENLAIVIRRILEIREGVRFLELLSNPVEREKALAIATGLVGFTCNPVIIEAVQMGVMLAKAFDLAVKDVRNLANGKKIPITDKFKSMALDYSQYVLVLMLLQNQDKVALRSLDVIENVVNRELKEGKFYCDETVTAMKAVVGATRPWLFYEHMAIKSPDAVKMAVKTNLVMNYE